MFSQTASNRNTFIEDFVRRLGGRQVINVNDIVAKMRESVKEICGESVNEIESMYNEMKQKVEEASTSMYDIQTSTCNGDIAKIAEDTISSFNKIDFEF